MDLNETYARIGEYIESHPSATYGQIGTTLGLSRSQVARIARLRGIRRRPGERSAALQAAVAIIDAATPQPGFVSEGEVAIPPTEELITAVTAAPPVEEALPTTLGTPPAEIAVA